ncbi:hypothetical protein C8R45DRAFT_935313 [Mycena sanguinolenta]|nr:hypothetical protein C8R45DRAFT_935313 [Mycena sanguinolenta]
MKFAGVQVGDNDYKYDANKKNPVLGSPYVAEHCCHIAFQVVPVKLHRKLLTLASQDYSFKNEDFILATYSWIVYDGRPPPFSRCSPPTNHQYLKVYTRFGRSKLFHPHYPASYSGLFLNRNLQRRRERASPADVCRAWDIQEKEYGLNSPVEAMVVQLALMEDNCQILQTQRGSGSERRDGVTAEDGLVWMQPTFEATQRREDRQWGRLAESELNDFEVGAHEEINLPRAESGASS